MGRLRRFLWILALALVLASEASGPLHRVLAQDRSKPSGWPDLTVTHFLENQPRAETKQDVLELDSGDVNRYYAGNVRWDYTTRGNRLVLHCDRLVFFVPGGRQWFRERQKGDQAKPLPFSVYADGNVHLELPDQGTLLEAESLFYDHARRLAVAHNAKISSTVSGVQRLLSAMQERDVRGTRPHPRRRGTAAMPVVVRADVVKTTDFWQFEASGVHASNCDYGEAHWGVRAESGRVVRHERRRGVDEDDEGAPLEEGVDERYFTLELDDLYLELGGTAVLPLPSLYWDTRWNNYFPIRSVEFGHSSKFGTVAGADWNLNFFLEQIPLEEVPFLLKILRRSRLDFETTYFSDRGFGYGPKGEYGTSPRRWLPWQLGLESWDYYGEGRYFGIRDHGEDRVTGAPPPDEDRFWGSIYHRHQVPYLGLLDIEYSEFSDRNFLREYFETIAKQEKEQESLFSLRRNVTDNLALTGLYKYRTNDFVSDVERIPEGKLLLLQQSVFGSGLYTDVVSQAANLRFRPAEGSGLSSRRLGRADLLNEWSYPFPHLHPYLDARPFAVMRFSAYEEVADPSAGGEDRASFGAGITVSQQWSRVFEMGPDSLIGGWLGVDQVKHVVVPRMTYFNLFANDLDSEDILGLDDVDAVDLSESFTISLRQGLLVRRRTSNIEKARPLLGQRDITLETAEYKSRSILDSDVRFSIFPQPNRDNDGDQYSLLIADNTFTPFSGFRLRAWLGFNPNEDLRLERADGSLSVAWWRRVLSTTVGNRLNRREGAPDNHFVYGLVTLFLGEKWRAQAYYSRDIEEGRDVEYSFALARVFHRFALMLEYSMDVGEDRNQSISVNFAPLDLVGGMLSGRQSRW